MSKIFSRLVVACALSLLATLQSTRADSPPPRPSATEFEKLMARIRAAHTSKDWQKDGWKDEAIESTCKKVLKEAKSITGRATLELPVEFKDARIPRGDRIDPFQSNTLRVERGNVDVGFATKAIYLVDGSIRISHASDCIVIARGIVEISHSNNCLVVAGHHVSIGHDGNGGFRGGREGGQTPPAGTIAISGGSIDIAHAHGTICSAPRHVQISHATQVDFIASPRREIGDRGCRFHDKAPPLLTIPSPESLPDSLFTVSQVIAGDDATKQLITVKRNGIEYVLRPGGKIIDEKGQPFSAWSNWTLGFIAENFVLFTDGDNDRSIRTQ